MKRRSISEEGRLNKDSVGAPSPVWKCGIDTTWNQDSSQTSSLSSNQLDKARRSPCKRKEGRTFVKKTHMSLTGVDLYWNSAGESHVFQ
ncbi:hypothetical protein WICPIJ_010051 [Wickerhamomyces pijperi]|uniref:Uncharacterized protein n=1 Tax=Wickerhamomyces pijperi TaxID=599730 RepID=A0A9P8PHP2_WICPI|nr:hypothetical protein WICPIJ_010051 [Wickerhamomyces pijperi]